jgi:hypothetical protein
MERIHGSGIDYDWYAETRGENVVLYNAYHLMNDVGMYYAISEFAVVLPKSNPNDFKIQYRSDMSRYYGNKHMLKSYLEDLIAYELSTYSGDKSRKQKRIIKQFQVSIKEWDDNRRWKESNPHGVLVALLHEKAGRIDLTRSANRHEYFTHGVMVPYPRRKQRKLDIPPHIMGDGSPGVIDLEWVYGISQELSTYSGDKSRKTKRKTKPTKKRVVR